MANKIIKIGLVGLGTVGSGVARLLLANRDSIARKTGLALELACVVDTDTQTPRPVKLPPGILTDNFDKLLGDESIGIGIELVGGTTIAKDIQLKMLAAGKNVVTANKALLAEHGAELYAAAVANNRCIAFEGSCAGGVPIISAIRTGLAANRINAIYGILNGTCNYILSNMTAKNTTFPDALDEAKAKGYAEADPTLDINGTDSAHKLAILGSVALGYEIGLQDIFVEGIEQIRTVDIRYGREMGYVLKLLAIAQKGENDHLSFRVHPSFIAKENSLARVDGPFNAVSVFGDFVGQTTYYGRGAGMDPTASAVVADVIDVALGNSANIFKNLRIKPRAEVLPLIDTIDKLIGSFYIRLILKDQPGVVAQIGKILADHTISISGILQRESPGPEGHVPVVITTHPTPQQQISGALADLGKLEAVCTEPVCIRIVDIPEDRD